LGNNLSIALTIEPASMAEGWVQKLENK